MNNYKKISNNFNKNKIIIKILSYNFNNKNIVTY